MCLTAEAYCHHVPGTMSFIAETSNPFLIKLFATAVPKRKWYLYFLEENYSKMNFEKFHTGLKFVKN